MMLEILDLFLVLHQVNFFWNPTDFLLLANAVTEINCPIGLAFYSWILSVLKFFVSQLWLEIINHDQWYLMRSAATPGAASLTNMRCHFSIPPSALISFSRDFTFVLFVTLGGWFKVFLRLPPYMIQNPHFH